MAAVSDMLGHDFEGPMVCVVSNMWRSMCMSIFWLSAPMVAVIIFGNFGLVKM